MLGNFKDDGLKKLVSKAKESQKMLQWMKMDSNELKWVR
jgi:hypothetical protein